jgi:hypothetical protein
VEAFGVATFYDEVVRLPCVTYTCMSLLVPWHSGTSQPPLILLTPTPNRTRFSYPSSWCMLCIHINKHTQALWTNARASRR